MALGSVPSVRLPDFEAHLLCLSDFERHGDEVLIGGNLGNEKRSRKP